MPPEPDHRVPEEGTILAALGRRVRENPDGIAVKLLGDGERITESMTYAELWCRAGTMAAGLPGMAGRPVLLTLPPGPAFIAGLLGCWRTGALAVPCYPPRGRRHRERLEAVARDCGATLALGEERDRETLAALGVSLAVAGPELAIESRAEDETATCLLQYTSGSTRQPRGVMLSAANLRHQVRTTRSGLEPLGLKSVLSWLPPYHDMGLVLKVLLALDGGLPLTVMTPEHFVQSPLRWVRAISNEGAEFSGGPNFAYELCARAAEAAPELLEGLDLSCWKAASCGAERVRPETLRRFAKAFAAHGFREEAFLPGYGLAEATLIVAAKRPLTPWRESAGLVSCGPPLDGVEVRTAEDGEILVKGPGVGLGYWPGEALPEREGWLATGDLGFLEDGELFVTGRLKDLLILDGVNHAPDDVEAAAALAAGGGAAAAFSIPTERGELAALAIECPATDAGGELCRKIRSETGEATGVSLSKIALVRPGTLPRTTSGKVRRGAVREEYLEGRLRSFYHEDSSISGVEENPPGEEEEATFALLKEAMGRTEPRLEDDPADYGLGSIEVTRAAARLKENSGIELAVGDFYAARSFRELVRILATRRAEKICAPQRLPRRPEGAEPGLTHSQERMWFLHQLDPNSAAYHVFGALELTGRWMRKRWTGPIGGSSGGMRFCAAAMPAKTGGRWRGSRKKRRGWRWKQATADGSSG